MKSDIKYVETVNFMDKRANLYGIKIIQSTTMHNNSKSKARNKYISNSKKYHQNISLWRQQYVYRKNYHRKISIKKSNSTTLNTNIKNIESKYAYRR